MYLKYQYETCNNHVANTVPFFYPYSNFKNHEFKLQNTTLLSVFKF